MDLGDAVSDSSEDDEYSAEVKAQFLQVQRAAAEGNPPGADGTERRPVHLKVAAPKKALRREPMLARREMLVRPLKPPFTEQAWRRSVIIGAKGAKWGQPGGTVSLRVGLKHRRLFCTHPMAALEALSAAPEVRMGPSLRQMEMEPRLQPPAGEMDATAQHAKDVEAVLEVEANRALVEAGPPVLLLDMVRCKVGKSAKPGRCTVWMAIGTLWQLLSGAERERNLASILDDREIFDDRGDASEASEAGAAPTEGSAAAAAAGDGAGVGGAAGAAGAAEDARDLGRLHELDQDNDHEPSPSEGLPRHAHPRGYAVILPCRLSWRNFVDHLSAGKVGHVDVIVYPPTSSVKGASRGT